MQSRRLIDSSSSCSSSAAEDEEEAVVVVPETPKSTLRTKHVQSKLTFLVSDSPVKSPLLKRAAPIDTQLANGNFGVMRKRLFKRSVLPSQTIISSSDDDETSDVHEDCPTKVKVTEQQENIFASKETASYSTHNAQKVSKFVNALSTGDLIELLGDAEAARLFAAKTPFDCDAAVATFLHETLRLSAKVHAKLTDVAKQMRLLEAAAAKMVPIVQQLVQDEAQTALLTMQEIFGDKNGLQGRSLKAYQLAGVSWFARMHRFGLGGILADEMGLGKTVQVIAFISYLRRTQIDCGPYVVVCPASTLDNWLQEFGRWDAALTVHRYAGSLEERLQMGAEVLQQQKEDCGNSGRCFVIVTTYAIATGGAFDRRFLRKLQPSLLVADEGHFLKNAHTKTHRQLASIAARCKFLLTGTPIQNDLVQVATLLRFVLPVARFNMEAVTCSLASEACMAFKTHKMRCLLMPFVLRRQKCDVVRELPPKTYMTAFCDMFPSQQRLAADLGTLTSGQWTGSSSNAHFMHRRKVANHPLLFRSLFDDAAVAEIAKFLSALDEYTAYGDGDDLYREMCAWSDFEIDAACRRYPTRLGRFLLPTERFLECGKVVRLKNILDDIFARSPTDKVLIFSQFTTMLDILEEVLHIFALSFVRLDGSTPVAERCALIDEFSRDARIKIFLLSSKAAGFGVNLTAANHAILYDVDYNPHNDKQAEDRCHRIGQEKPVYVYKLVSKDSIEEQALEAAQGKIELNKNMLQT